MSARKCVYAFAVLCIAVVLLLWLDHRDRRTANEIRQRTADRKEESRKKLIQIEEEFEKSVRKK